ncbi:hypothetical protein AAC387_Pa04g2755 [Persea americana]
MDLGRPSTRWPLSDTPIPAPLLPFLLFSILILWGELVATQAVINPPPTSLKQVEAMGEEMKGGGHEHESGNAELCRQVICMASKQLHHEGRDKFATRR